jgi:hypothetical protein
MFPFSSRGVTFEDAKRAAVFVMQLRCTEPDVFVSMPVCRHVCPAYHVRCSLTLQLGLCIADVYIVRPHTCPVHDHCHALFFCPAITAATALRFTCVHAPRVACLGRLLLADASSLPVRGLNGVCTALRNL